MFGHIITNNTCNGYYYQYQSPEILDTYYNKNITNIIQSYINAIIGIQHNTSLNNKVILLTYQMFLINII